MPVYDGLVLISFGGPEGPDDVMPFLENVVRGKNVPRQRLAAVAKHYELFGGISPINAQNRSLLTALLGELNAHGCQLPVYWGNRNWHPMLADTLRTMADDGVRHALAFVTSAFGSYPGCRQYLEDIAQAREAAGPDAPQVDKLRLFYNHPGFIETMAARVESALSELPAERRAAARLIYTAHSIPVEMARRSPYEHQLREACGLISRQVGRSEWQLAYQSRSGPPSQPWLEPNVGDSLRELGRGGSVHDVVIVPVGFLCEHMEVVYDLDVEVREICDELGLGMVRAGVAGNHPRLVRMIRELIDERLAENPTRLALGDDGPWPDECPPGCCASE